MSPKIDIDEEVWDLLKRDAEPFVDTPNTVLRRLLGMSRQPVAEAEPEIVSPVPSLRQRTTRTLAKTSKRQRRRGPRAPVGSLLAEREYEQPILKVLGEREGHAPARDVIKLVGELVDDRLMPLDREKLPNGLLRWESRVQFTRLRMRKAGLIKDDSPRGVWELSDTGQQAYSELQRPA
jgi:hypothetical protein